MAGKKFNKNRLAAVLGLASTILGGAPRASVSAKETATLNNSVTGVLRPTERMTALRESILDGIRAKADKLEENFDILMGDLRNPKESWKWKGLEQYQDVAEKSNQLELKFEALQKLLDSVDSKMVSDNASVQSINDAIREAELLLKDVQKGESRIQDKWDRIKPKMETLLLKSQTKDKKKLDNYNQESKYLIQQTQALGNRLKDSMYDQSEDTKNEVRGRIHVIEQSLSNLSKNLESGNLSSEGAWNIKLRAEAANEQMKDVQKLVDRYMIERTRANVDEEIAALARRVDIQDKTVKQAINMNLERRSMRSVLKSRLQQIKSDLNAVLSSMRDTVSSLSVSQDDAAIKNAKTTIEDGSIRISKLLLNWQVVLSDVEKDDLARAYWTPEGRQSAQRQQLRQVGNDVRSNLNLNLRDKTVRICQEIHRIQPGCGVKVRPLVEQFLNHSVPSNAYDEEGNVNENWFANRQFVLSGQGGTGKTSSVHLVAEAMDAKVLTVTAADLRDEVKNARLLQELQLYTRGSSSQKVIVLFDEVDAATCDQIGKSGTNLERLRKRLETGVSRESSSADMDNPDSQERVRPKWRLSGSESKKSQDDSALDSAPSIHGLRRSESAFRGLSKVIDEIAHHPTPSILGIVSTMNRELSDLPSEVSRRVCKDQTHVVRMGLPTEANLVKVITSSLPGLYFGDGFSREEGIKKIAKIAFNKNWSAIQVLDTLGRIAEMGTPAADGECFLPCNTICRYINGVASEDQLRRDIQKIDAERAASMAAEDKLSQSSESVNTPIIRSTPFASENSESIDWEQLIEG